MQRIVWVDAFSAYKVPIIVTASTIVRLKDRWRILMCIVFGLSSRSIAETSGRSLLPEYLSFGAEFYLVITT